jgi:hypothetical protein
MIKQVEFPPMELNLLSVTLQRIFSNHFEFQGSLLPFYQESNQCSVIAMKHLQQV